MTLTPIAAAEFAALLDPLGPFEPKPRLAVAVSGGADSMALALLAADWATARGGGIICLIVDHGLRPAAAAEAREARGRLAGLGIQARILTLGLALGPGMSARARAARYAALEEACAALGIPHLLLGHHAADQAETVVMRAMAGSHADGLAGMATIVETRLTRWLRPLLMVPPGRARATLRARDAGWCEDPSNADPIFARSRLRAIRGDPDGTSAATRATVEAARARGAARAAREDHIAAWLAAQAELHPAGYASIPDAALPPDALAVLIRTIAGSTRKPRGDVAGLAAAPRAATLGGVRLLPGGRPAPGRWLLIREGRATAPPVNAVSGAIWDGRFRVAADAALAEGATLGPLGNDASALPHRGLPAALRRTLPAIRCGDTLVAVPHLGYGDTETCCRALIFSPPLPVACAPFPASPDGWAGVDAWGCQVVPATLC